MYQVVATNFKNFLFQKTHLQEANHFDYALCVLTLCTIQDDEYGNYSHYQQILMGCNCSVLS